MSSTSQENMQLFLDKVYSNIYNILAPKIGKDDNPTYLMSMFTTGITLDEDFDISMFANQIPQVSKNYVDTGKKIQDVYPMILGAVCPPDDTERARQEKDKYDAAANVIYSDFDNLVESPKYEAYKEFRNNYNDAVDAYYAEENKAKASQDRAKLRRLKQEMDAAFSEFVAHGKSEIENALNIMAAYGKYTTSSIFKKAGADFQNVFEYDVATIPAAWTDDESIEHLAWKKVEVVYSQESSSVYKSVANAKSEMSESFQNGWWIFYSKKGSNKSKDMGMTSEANSKVTMENVTMVMEVAVIKLYRDWLDLTLLNHSDVYLQGQKAGCITNGSLQGCNDCAMPIIPESLILARNIKVYGDFSNEERELFEKAKSHTESSITYGPFTVSDKDSYCYDSHDVKDDEWTKFSTPFKLEFGGSPQIIGVLNSILKPCFPKKDSE